MDSNAPDLKLGRTKSVSVPSPSKEAVIWAWTPRPMASITTTAATPMTMPSSASIVRSLLAPREKAAVLMTSRGFTLGFPGGFPGGSPWRPTAGAQAGR